MFKSLKSLKGILNRRIYLDYASVTPVDTRVLKDVLKNSKEFSANPSSLYKEGVLARKKLENARARVAACLEAQPDEIFFTSGGTESNNLAIQGVLVAAKKSELFSANAPDHASNPDQAANHASNQTPNIISSEIEHPSVRELLENLQKSGWCSVTYVPVDKSGIVDPKEIKKALKPETVLVSIMYANNEIGTIQPIHEIAKVIRDFKKARKLEAKDDMAAVTNEYPYFHTDASQAAAYEPLRQPYLGVDLMTLDGSKIYGPRSTGILYINRGVKAEPLMHGGSQEKRSNTPGGRSFGFRPGTENVANACGFALALEICQQEREKEVARISLLRDEVLGCIQKAVAAVLINGDTEKRLPNNINICLPGIDAEFAVLKLDARGVCVSSVTSCRAQDEDSSSYVIEALGRSNDEALGGHGGHMPKDASLDGQKAPARSSCSMSSLRITLGRFTSRNEAKRATKHIIEVLTAML